MEDEFQIYENQNTSENLEIRFIEHDGSLVPKLFRASNGLIKQLRENGAEILNDNITGGEYIIYVQQYTEEEQNALDNCEGFHRGFTIKSFFEANSQLIQYINKENLAEFQFFFDQETYQFLIQ
ncbi:hypothetical protein TTHERM_000794599 (macronuclear) [Tetrahymena thermophila SB210]|uniref:Uncharacterized protein n=1 Tax=Tetrahymena thermophila (strain SB210) TaxID=312017 RepID=W7X9U5_TETTS|nr:hypothetical protein TTHERM_000794599 [Tetrahymena thermophila SB210]EWS73178.1 hypothetical protein TTHERM_000794599 [Tetrahymena thermophila SB210]|eukprot:XP_012654298.1 hypothetical protein TTHERM_000794599 [Tetrahymena thermophila SB210]